MDSFTPIQLPEWDWFLHKCKATFRIELSYTSSLYSTSLPNSSVHAVLGVCQYTYRLQASAFAHEWGHSLRETGSKAGGVYDHETLALEGKQKAKGTLSAVSSGKTNQTHNFYRITTSITKRCFIKQTPVTKNENRVNTIMKNVIIMLKRKYLVRSNKHLM